MKPLSYWLDTAPAGPDYSSVEVPGKADVAVVGGGLTGLSTAIHAMDRLCHAGEHDGLYYSLGYNGHGVQMATYMGKQMAEVMAGHPEANPWHGLPFPAVPLHFGPPWFLPFADLYYRAKDAIA